jgi:hypothetical protein
MTIEFLNDGPTPRERQRKREFYRDLDEQKSYAKATKAKKDAAADDGDHYLRRRAPKFGKFVHRIWPKERRDYQVDEQGRVRWFEEPSRGSQPGA